MNVPHCLDLITFACERELIRANGAFLARPTADAWKSATRAMLAYQQIKHAARSCSVDRAALVNAVGDAPVDEWADVICRATLGMNAAAVLAA